MFTSCSLRSKKHPRAAELLKGTEFGATSTTKGFRDFPVLPDDLWIKIMKLLSMEDLGRLQLTCREFDRIFLQREDDIYQSVVDRLWVGRHHSMCLRSSRPRIAALSRRLYRSQGFLLKMNLRLKDCKKTFKVGRLQLSTALQERIQEVQASVKILEEAVSQLSGKIGCSRRSSKKLVDELQQAKHEMQDAQEALGYYKKIEANLQVLTENLHRDVKAFKDELRTYVKYKNLMQDSLTLLRSGCRKVRLQKYYAPN
eukprot:jgi/Botrbrau1/20661/Bobra.0779s0002.1